MNIINKTCPFEVHILEGDECQDFEKGWEKITVYENMQLKDFRWVLKSLHPVNRVRENIAELLIWLASKIGAYNVHAELDVKKKEQ